MWHRVLRQFSNSPFQNEWGSQSTRRVITNYQVYKDNMAIVFVPIKAKFNMRENYFNLKTRGTIMIDFIPMHESAYDTNKVFFI